jgi:hypothetical protein
MCVNSAPSARLDALSEANVVELNCGAIDMSRAATEAQNNSVDQGLGVKQADKNYQKADICGKVAEELGKIREVARGTGDRLLLYLIDMAILQACESICAILRSSVAKDLEPRRNKFLVTSSPGVAAGIIFTRGRLGNCSPPDRPRRIALGTRRDEGLPRFQILQRPSGGVDLPVFGRP